MLLPLWGSSVTVLNITFNVCLCYCNHRDALLPHVIGKHWQRNVCLCYHGNVVLPCVISKHCLRNVSQICNNNDNAMLPHVTSQQS